MPQISSSLSRCTFPEGPFGQAFDQLDHFGVWVYDNQIDFPCKFSERLLQALGKLSDQRPSLAFSAAPTSDGVSSTVTPAASSAERLDA
jgi:hypothetical protein